VYSPDGCYLEIKLDMDAISKLHLRVDAAAVRSAILKGTPGHQRVAVMRALKDRHVLMDMYHNDKLEIYAPEMRETGQHSINPSRRQYFILQALKSCLPEVIVQGVPTVSRAVINELEGSSGSEGGAKYNLLIEGYGVADVMGTPGVDGRNVTSNHIIEVEKVLGIEAARTVIAMEIRHNMKEYGIKVDTRHLMLLSDVMTFKGEVLGITRFGVAKMRESVLMLASFEKTTDHLFDAAVHGRTDAIVGVSECIIMGIPIPLGTGLFKLLHSAEKPKLERHKPLLYQPLPRRQSSSV